MNAIQEAIRDYVQAAVNDTLENLITDFEAESKDEKANGLLRRLIEYYTDNPSQKSPVGGSATTVVKSDKPNLSPCGHEKTTLIVNTGTTGVTGTTGTTGVTGTSTGTTSTAPVTSSICSSLIKSGKRKGMICGGKVSDSTGLCKRHQPRAEKGHSDAKCEALMKGGTRKGQICGVAIAAGEMYCARHKVTKCIFKKPDGNPCGWSISRCSPSESYCRIHIREELNLDTKSFVLYTNSFGNKEHRYSGLVFEDKKVIGVQHPSGTVSNYLNDEDLECVRIYGLPLSEAYIDKMKDYLNRRQLQENGK